MDHFLYRAGRLHAEDVDLAEVAAEIGTPAYVYSAATLRRHYRVVDEALGDLPHLIAYAMKANSNLAVIKLLGDLGAGMDTVSGGEIARAEAAGIPPSRIVFSGVGKTDEELRLALSHGIRQVNVESWPELERLSALAVEAGTTATIAIRINPDVDAKTHAKIATGSAETKFGVPFDEAPAIYARAAELPGIAPLGVDIHIGSQLTDLSPYRAAFTRVAELTQALRAQGIGIERLDLGGGLGIPYVRDNDAPPVPAEYGQVVRETVGHLGCEIEVEPGRVIAGNAGVLLASVIYTKRGARDFLILDAAMNDLLRPAMYDAWHDVVPLTEPPAGAPRSEVDIVGPVCETGDRFAQARPMPALSPGDRVAFRSAGAYGAVMASEYNSRPLVPEVLVDGGRWAVVRPRPSVAEMLGRDRLPEWLRD